MMPWMSVAADGEALLRGVAERLNKLDQDSDTDIKDIDDFTKGIELGKYPLCLELTKEKRKEVLDTIGDIWDALVEESVTRANSSDLVVSKSSESINPTFDNNMPSKVAPSDPIVQSVYIHDKPRSYNGPWMIRNSPIILKKWSMDTHLCKDDLTRIPVWVKIHDVPIQVFSENVLSIIASQIGKPIMLDSYTTSMCIESRGRSSFARCLIEIGVPLIEGTGFTIETVTIEYEWKPPWCDLCKIFDHVQDHCPKKVSITPFAVTSSVATPTVEKTNDRFQTVGKNKKNKKGKSKSTNGGQFGGNPVKQTVRYALKATTSAPNKGTILKTTVSSTMNDNIPVSNPYFALDEESEEEVENVYDESANLLQSKKTGGSSSTFTVGAG
ncbi:zinc knuckle CX2CX4HX4C containing protein [Tanacetum coccineum]